MTKKSYGEKLRDPRWQRVRLEVMSRDNFSCRLCGDETTPLNVHHLQYMKEPWDCPIKYLLTLCEDCHLIVTMQEIDLNENPTEIRKLQRTHHMTYVCFTKEGAMFFMKEQGQPIKFHGGASHEVLRYVVHDVINYWLKTDRDHYLTEKFVAAHG